MFFDGVAGNWLVSVLAAVAIFSGGGDTGAERRVSKRVPHGLLGGRLFLPGIERRERDNRWAD